MKIKTLYCNGYIMSLSARPSTVNTKDSTGRVINTVKYDSDMNGFLLNEKAFIPMHRVNEVIYEEEAIKTKDSK